MDTGNLFLTPRIMQLPRPLMPQQHTCLLGLQLSATLNGETISVCYYYQW